MKLVKDEFKQNYSWNNVQLENCLKDWLSNKFVKLFEGLPYILVNIIQWACTVQIFKKEEVPLEISVGLIIKISKEFKLDPKEKKIGLPIMSELN
jgi:hypothetical protein